MQVKIKIITDLGFVLQTEQPSAGQSFFYALNGGKELYMTENTISINSSAAEAAENDISTAEAAENSRYDAQGNDWQNIEERESDDVHESETSGDGETTLPQEEKIKLTVYGEEVEVSFEEAKAAAQKGMAFERVKAQLANAKENIHLKTMEQIAAAKGKTLAQLVADVAHEEEYARLTEKYGSMDHVPLDELADSVGKLSQLKNQLYAGQKAEASESWSNQLREFMEDNPQHGTIPDEVIEAAKQTGSLALAYSDYNARQLAEELGRTKAELEMLKAEKETAKGITPSAKSVASYGSSEDDAFRKMMRSTW